MAILEPNFTSTRGYPVVIAWPSSEGTRRWGEGTCYFWLSPYITLHLIACKLFCVPPPIITSMGYIGAVNNNRKLNYAVLVEPTKNQVTFPTSVVNTIDFDDIIFALRTILNTT